MAYKASKDDPLGQYPPDYHPSEKGRCERCGYVTKGWTDRWLLLCPNHWQEIASSLRPYG